MEIKLKDSEELRNLILTVAKDGKLDEIQYSALLALMAGAMKNVVDAEIKRISSAPDNDIQTVQHLIVEVCDEIKDMLLEKNRNYGNSAIFPLRIFSKASSVEQIHVRLDDKLSRLTRGSAAGEDVFKDLIGYLVLREVALRFDSKEKKEDDVPF